MLRCDVSACQAHADCIGFHSIPYTSGAETSVRWYIFRVWISTYSQVPNAPVLTLRASHVSKDTRYGLVQQRQFLICGLIFANAVSYSTSCYAGICGWLVFALSADVMRALSVSDSASGICFGHLD